MKKIFIDKVEFEITRKIAIGGMGAVYEALQKGVRGFAKTVAIKTILQEFSSDKHFVEDFVSEAMLVANLVHENIVQIYQLGKYQRDYYFVLEYVDGISLHDFMDMHLKLKSRLPVKLAVFIASRIARGLAYAHARKDKNGESMNIVHCDVCSHNILINTEGVPKLTDFGIARANVRNQDKNGISGKLPFVSPEQVKPDCFLDFRSDIYSLGVVLFFMLTGEFPRGLSQSLKDIVGDIKNNNIRWNMLPEDIDDELKGLLQTMMALEPDDRFQDTAELARALEYYIYKDGYGPTIVTLSEYMKDFLPGEFSENSIVTDMFSTDVKLTDTFLGKTLKMDATQVLQDRIPLD
jgi:serine/threonine protein kinase